MLIITAAARSKWFSTNLSKLRPKTTGTLATDWLENRFFPFYYIYILHLCIFFYKRLFISHFILISNVMFNMSENRIKKQRILCFKSLPKHRLMNCLSENHRFFSEYQSLRGFSRLVSKITQECRVTVRVMMADHWRESDCNGSQLISCNTAVIFTLFITSSMCSVRF